MPLLAALVLALLIPAASLAAFGGGSPYESPRVGTPNDPDFDRCEADNEEAPPDCATYADEEFRAFGFSPDSANELPAAAPHYATGTRYTDCTQLDPHRAGRRTCRRRKPAIRRAISSPSAYRSAASAPTAPGSSRLGIRRWPVAILDTGIRWQSTELVDKVRLNTAELPLPRRADGSTWCRLRLHRSQRRGRGERE